MTEKIATPAEYVEEAELCFERAANARGSTNAFSI